MNVDIKTKTLLFAAASITPPVTLSSVIGPGSRLLGIMCISVNAGDVAVAKLSLSILGGFYPAISINQTLNGFARLKWLGIQNHKDLIIPTGAPAANTMEGTFPCMPQMKWFDEGVSANVELALEVINTLFGITVLFYTTSPPNPMGEHA